MTFSLLILAVLTGLVLVHRGQAARAATTQSTKLYTPPPQPPPPLEAYRSFAGLWRTDGSFDSTLRIRNELLVAPLDVTPILFMADGSEYHLAPVHLATGGVAVVDINQALAAAPANVAGHLSQFGSAELQWQYTSPGHVVASVQMLNVPQSLVFVTPFNGVDDTMTGAHAVEGLWWRRDPEVGGYVSLANVTDSSITATVQATGSGGTMLPAGTFTLAAHATQMLDLDELVGGLPGTENQAGGIRVQYQGAMNALMVTGGLVNPREGYSAAMPFWFHNATMARPSRFTYTSTGLMHGFPNPAMGFPEGVRFKPYLVLRNTGANTLSASLALNWMSGASPETRSLPPAILAAGQTTQYDMAAAIANLGLRNFNGPLTVSVSFTGHPGDLVMATGSVDDTGTYVFEAEPQGVSQSLSKQLSYWTTANGFDTVLMLDNPTISAEDLTVTFYYGDGSGSYVLPVHLAAKGSKMVDVEVLVESQQPDANGKDFPMTETEGSAIIRDASSTEKKPVPLTLISASGVYNVQTATCGTNCVTCCGYSGFYVLPAEFFCPVGWSMQCSAGGTDCNGNAVGLVAASWSSSDATVATIDSSGLMTAVAPGSVTMEAAFEPVTATSGTVCFNGGSAYCPTESPDAVSSGSVTPSVSVSCSPTDLAIGASAGAAPSSTTRGSCSTTVNPGGGSFSWSASKNTVSLSPNGASASFASANKSASSGDTTITVNYTYNSQSASATSAGITVHQPTSLSVLIDTTNRTGYT